MFEYRQLAPKDLALLMQQERIAAAVEPNTSSAIPAASVETEMHTMKTYKRVRVEKGAPSDDSTFFPCIVSGGQVLPLKKRVSVERDISFQSTQLLSTSMKDLLMEADELKLRSSLSNGSNKSGQEHPSAYRGGVMDLWVDKYSPQAFPQVRPLLL